MNKTKALLLSVGICVFIQGCASLPQAKLKYYLPVSNLEFDVSRTLSCSKSKDLVTVWLVTPKVTTLADLELGQYEIDLEDLSGRFSDSEVKTEFFKDGRLMNYNSTSTGKGKEILEGGISLLKAALGAVPDQRMISACDFIEQNGKGEDGETKTLTISYTGRVALAALPSTGEVKPKTPYKEQALLAIEKDKASAAALGSLIGGVCVKLYDLHRYSVIHPKVTTEVPMITHRHPTVADVRVVSGGASNCGGTDVAWAQRVQFIEAGEANLIQIPIPKPSLFGKSSLNLSIADSGEISKLDFVANSGAADALSIGTSVLGELGGSSDSEKLSEIKTKADLIQQTERLARCEANRAEC